MNKKIISLALLYLIQFLSTSCCECDPVMTYEVQYNGLELNAWDTSGFQDSKIEGPVYKNSFGLTLWVESEDTQIALNIKKPIFSGFGFASAYACSCSSDEYIYNDLINSIEIIVQNSENLEEIVVTNHFTESDYDGNPITITELFQNRPVYDAFFQLDLTEYDNIPNSSIFKTKVFLESGIEFAEQTEIIIFEE